MSRYILASIGNADRKYCNDCPRKTGFKCNEFKEFLQRDGGVRHTWQKQKPILRCQRCLQLEDNFEE